MTGSSTIPDDLIGVLERSSARALSADVRASLIDAWQHLERGRVVATSWLVLADMIDALALLAADEITLLAALLFDVPELRAAFQNRQEAPWVSVSGLLEGQDAAAQVWTLHAGREAGRNSEGLRRLLLAIIQDLRVVPILLSRQLALMRAAVGLPEKERQALAQLTRDIHAPLANRLGIWQLKWELEDLAFQYLEPEIYRYLSHELDESRSEREHYIEMVKNQLGAALREQRIEGEVSGRPKHIFSIWRKMQKKQRALDQLYDLRAIRVMVADVAACYSVLGIVHELWTPISSEFDDYIARPKPNGYRSLHTAVIGPEGRAVEIQIRTHDMHAQAELGVAAHWRYKEGSRGAEKSFDRKITWMRQLLEQSVDGSRDGEGLAGALDAELVEDRVYALTPKGEVIDLPQGSTPLDFAYHVHTMVGHRCRGAKVNGRIVPLSYKLRSGDRVEILTGKEAGPRRDWLLPAHGYLASGRSRDKVRAWFHKLDRTRNVQDGKDLVDKELRRLGLLNADLGAVIKKFHIDSVEELYVQVALGDIGPSQLGRALHEQERATSVPSLPVTMAPPSRPRRRRSDSGFTVQGVGNLLVQLAKCCQPVAGEPIAGYLTRHRGVTVHRADCDAYARLATQNPQRVLAVEWGSRGEDGYDVDLQVRAVDRKWLLKDVTTLIAQEDAHVLGIHSDVRANGYMQLRLRLRVTDYGQLSTLLGKLAALPGVDQARRLG